MTHSPAGHREGLKAARLLMVFSSMSPLFFLWAIRGNSLGLPRHRVLLLRTHDRQQGPSPDRIAEGEPVQGSSEEPPATLRDGCAPAHLRTGIRGLRYSPGLRQRASTRRPLPGFDSRKDTGVEVAESDLKLIVDSGHIKLQSPKRQELLKMTLNGFGVQLQGSALEVHASPDNFALRKHNLVQSMLAVNDMFYLAVPMVASLFYEDVVAWLDVHDIRYTPKVKFTGKTGYDHLFDFVIPKSRRQPERIIQTINRPNRDTAQAVVLSWIDTREVRSADSKAYALLNDSEQTVSSAVLDALRSYDVQPVPWSQRESVREELAA